MIKKVQMPQLGQTVEEATIEVWHRKEGEKVEKGDVLLEITTDKATLEVESYFEGILKKPLYKEGDVVPVDAVIALIGDPDDEVSDEMVREALEAAAASREAQAAPAPSPAAAPQPQPSVAQPEAPAAQPMPTQAQATAVAEAPPGRLFASPRARRVARELLVPLQLVRGGSRSACSAARVRTGGSSSGTWWRMPSGWPRFASPPRPARSLSAGEWTSRPCAGRAPTGV